MSKVFIEESTLDDIANAIQEKDGSTDPIPTAEMAARIEAISGGYDEGYADGAASVPKFNEWGELKLFSLNVFNQKEVVLNLPRATTLNSFLIIMEDGDINTTVEHLTINCPNMLNSIAYAFNGAKKRKDTKLKKLTLNVDTSQASNSYLAFYVFAAVEEIDGTPLDLSGITANSGERMFELAEKLREIRFKGSIPCNLKFPVSPLSKDSMLSVFSCLSADVSGKTLTLNKEAVDKAFETSPGAADGSTSAEWLALVAEHSNWTISLV